MADKKITLLLVPGFPGNPDDVLTLGSLLSGKGINVCIFNPRGSHRSEGIFTHHGTLQDIANALRWLGQAQVQEEYHMDGAKIALGGYSYGGGMSLAYAAQNPEVKYLVSIAGNDHGEFARELQRNLPLAESFRNWLRTTHEPEGCARFDVEETIQSLIDHQEIFGLRENAARLADRAILMFGGWEDTGVTVDQCLLPFYRALKSVGAQDVTFLVYHDKHDFGNVRLQLANDIAEWLHRKIG